MDNFQAWKKLEEKIRRRTRLANFHEGEVWWSFLGLNVGHEQNGSGPLFERPVLVVRKFNSRMAWVVPLTSKVKAGPFYKEVAWSGGRGTAVLSQLRTVSSERLSRKAGRIANRQLSELREDLSALLQS